MQPAQSTNACRPTSRVSRPRNGRAALVVVAILCATPLKTEAALPPELEEIAEAYRQHYQTLKTLRIVCEEIPTPLMDRDVLWKHRKFYDAFPSTYTIVVQEGKVHHHTVRTKKPLGKVMDLLRKEDPSRDVIGSISLAEIQRLLPSVAEETSDATSVYDGSVLRVKSAHGLKVMDEERRCYSVKDTSKQGFRYLPDGYPHYIL